MRALNSLALPRVLLQTPSSMIRLLLILPALLLSACSAPGFAERKPGDPAKFEVTLERSFTKSN